MKLKTIGFALGAMVLWNNAAFADYLNLLDGGVGSFGGGVYFDAGANVGTVGTGNIDPFVRLQQNGSEQGYNTSGTPPYNEKTGPWTHDIQLSDLFVFSSPGNGIPGGDYYRFLLDINQEKHAPILSLDKIRIYASSTASIDSQLSGSSLPGATLLWDLDTAGYTCGNAHDNAECETSPEGQDNGALMNYSLNAGSGNGYDMFLWVPVGVFSGLNLDDYIYLYSAFGDSEGYETNDGIEEWAREITGPGEPPPPPPPPPGVPEPASLILLGIGLAGIAAAKRLGGQNR
jgi:hypothetical protein